ncbi:MAG: DUF2147 domain-containing protein [Alphaproteobacteria bacterium]|nr:DUF2147 domain-containing protein [Alphaproteobacteria bacterium]
MKKINILTAILTFVFWAASSWAAADIEGFWTTIDDETNEAKSIVQIYEYRGKYYGRIVDLLKNKEAKANLPNSPAIIGLDIIWDLEPDGKHYSGGEILDPKKGKVYGCEIWRDGENLVVRGKIAFFGRNQTWKPTPDYQSEAGLPLIPQKPKLK